MKKLPVFLAVLLCAGTAHAAESECTESKALAAARSDKSIEKFCAAPVNGANNGCYYKIRPASEGEVKVAQDLRWIIIASLIHSFDEKGQPRFMPEGATIVRVNKACSIADVLPPSLRHP